MTSKTDTREREPPAWLLKVFVEQRYLAYGGIVFPLTCVLFLLGGMCADVESVSNKRQIVTSELTKYELRFSFYGFFFFFNAFSLEAATVYVRYINSNRNF